MSSGLLNRAGRWSYPLAKRILFALDPETAHHLTIRALALLQKTPLCRFGAFDHGRGDASVEVMGLSFPNRVGLAAGLDKGADCIDALGMLGFGHIEVGTLTPRRQPGNRKPRLFRLVSAGGLINRMGFNNPGVEDAVSRLRKRRFPGVLGVNIGKNFDTPIADAARDYLEALGAVYPYADYVAVNVSSPNTNSLRELQEVGRFRPLIEALHADRKRLAQEHEKWVPIAVKIAPDLTSDQLDAMTDLLSELEVDGVIATNTTTVRDGLEGQPHAEESGGLSGRPLAAKATEIIARLRARLRPEIPIIGVGGIFSGEDALEKIEAGAALVQLYTGFVYRGPALIDEVLEAIRATGTCSSTGSPP